MKKLGVLLKIEGGYFFLGETYIPHRGPTKPLDDCFVSMDLDPLLTLREEAVDDKNIASGKNEG